VLVDRLLIHPTDRRLRPVPRFQFPMSSSTPEPDLAAVYHTFKKKYQELKNLRSDSVIADSVDLRQKVDEHRRIHEIAVGELRAQNEELKRMIHDAESNRSEVERLRDSVGKLRYQLQQRDPILSVFLKHTGFAIKVLGRRKFEIRADDALVFILEPANNGRDDDLQCHFTKYPPAFERSADTAFVRQGSTFRTASLEGFCSCLRRGLEAAEIWTRQ
jgi:hypothetical protein